MPDNTSSTGPTVDLIILYAFAGEEKADVWHKSDAKARAMAALEPLVESAVVLGGTAVMPTQAEMQLAEHQATLWGSKKSGWESMFVSDSALPTPVVAGRPRAAVPPRWKQFLCVLFSVWFTVSILTLPGALGAAAARAVNLAEHPWRSPLSTFIVNIVAVPIIVFILLPQVVKFAAPWLHQPKPESAAGRRAVVATTTARHVFLTIDLLNNEQRNALNVDSA